MDTTSVIQTLFGPLSHKYCLWYYALMVFAFISLLMFLVLSLYVGISKGMKMSYYFSLLIPVSLYLLQYFQLRLLYSMCSSSL